MRNPSPSPVTSRLPGVGEQLDVTDTLGQPVALIRRRSGHVEVHARGAAPLELDPTTASTVGAFISGHFSLSPDIAERLSDALGGLVIDWVRVRPDDAAVGHTIEALGVRHKTGVSIVAILRGSVPIVAPEPTMRLEARDDLVIACREGDRARFEAFVRGGT